MDRQELQVLKVAKQLLWITKHCTKMKFFIKDVFSSCDQVEKILNEKFYFLCSKKEFFEYFSNNNYPLIKPSLMAKSKIRAFHLNMSFQKLLLMIKFTCIFS